VVLNSYPKLLFHDGWNQLPLLWDVPWKKILHLNQNNLTLSNTILHVSETPSYGTSTLPPVILADTPSLWKVRYTLGLMGFLGLALVYAMRVNLSVVIVAMVNNSGDKSVNITHDACPAPTPHGGPTPKPVSTRRFPWILRITHCFHITTSVTAYTRYI